MLVLYSGCIGSVCVPMSAVCRVISGSSDSSTKLKKLEVTEGKVGKDGTADEIVE